MSSIAGVLVDNNFPLQGKDGVIVSAPKCHSTGVNFFQNDLYVGPTDYLSQPVPEAGTYLVTTQLNTKGQGLTFDARFGYTATLLGELDSGGPQVTIKSFAQIDLVVHPLGGDFAGYDSMLNHCLVEFTGPGTLFVRIGGGFYNTSPQNWLIGGSCITLTKIDLVSGTAIVV